jgi:hypothetical protein
LLVPLAVGALLLSCGSIPNDPGPRIFPPAGVIRGTVVYQGPHPCSRNGHIVGNAVVLVFDRRNQPPPNGLANTAPNFGDVTGDTLFANEPRYQGGDTYCPATHGITDTITATGQFEIAPLAGGSYEIQAFFDYTGDWLPEFKIRNLPELGDIAGGDIDTADALKPGNVNNINYQPIFIPVNVGIPQPLGSAGAGVPNAIPNFVIPDEGFVADNVTVTVGLKLPLTRPYFYAQGWAASVDMTGTTLSETQLQSSDVKGNVATFAPQQQPPLETQADPNSGYYAPVLTIPQDIEVFAPPKNPLAANTFESRFPRLKLMAIGTGTEQSELPYATGAAYPFHMQIGAGLLVWPNSVFDPAKQQFIDQQIPEGNSVPLFWPLVVLNKLIDGNSVNDHTADPASLTAQGSPTAPVVIMQAITELGTTMPPDTLFGAGFPELGSSNAYVDATTGKPLMVAPQNHVNALIRPSVICFNSLFDATNPDKRGVLVAPHLTGDSADNPPIPNTPIVPTDLLTNTDPARQSVKGLIKPPFIQGCLPKGRYAINLVYPDGQAWTVPNEAGACSGTEGATNYGGLSCTLKPRPVLLSQGTRAVVEIVGPQYDPMNCTNTPGKVPPVPAECLPTAPPQQ